VPTFVLLTRSPPAAGRSPETLEALQREAVRRIPDDGAGAGWITDCVVFGPYDRLDVFYLPDAEKAAETTTLILVHGRELAR